MDWLDVDKLTRVTPMAARFGRLWVSSEVEGGGNDEPEAGPGKIADYSFLATWSPP